LQFVVYDLTHDYNHDINPIQGHKGYGVTQRNASSITDKPGQKSGQHVHEDIPHQGQFHGLELPTQEDRSGYH
jgi:hypothetical protein